MLSRFAFLASAPLAVACSVGSARAATAQLRVGAVPNDPYAEAYFGLDMGLFEQAGLDVSVVTLQNGAAVAAAVASGALDVGVTNPVELATAVLHGLPFLFIAGGAYYSATAPFPVVCVAKSSRIANVKQLAGQTIGVNALHDIGEAAIRAYFAQHGADASRLEFVELRFNEMGVALNGGRITAGLISEPALTAALDAGQVRILADVYDAVGKLFYISAWFTTTTWYEAHRDVARRFAEAMYATARWANDHHAESAAILTRYSKVPLATTTRMIRSHYSVALQPEYVQPQLDVAAQYGLTPRRVLAAELIAPALRSGMSS